MVIWSTWGLMVRWLALPPVVILFYSSLIAGIAVPVVLAARGELDLTGVAAVWPWFSALFLASLVNNITYFYALGHTTVSNAVFTHYTAPLFVAVLAPLIIGERLRRVTLLSLPLAAAGMMMIVGSGEGLQFTKGHGQGIMAGTASGLAYALLIVASRKLSRMRMHHKAVVLVPWVTACVTGVPAFFEQSSLDGQRIGLLLVAGILHSTVAPLLYYSALRHVIAQYAAILGYMEPVVAVPLAFLFLSEAPAGLALAGGALILFSGYLVIREKPANDGQT
jgi:drug/metabolite transporter (DMT)-like permease